MKAPAEELERVLAEQVRRVTPTRAERERLDSAVDAILARARNVRASEAELSPFEPLIVGSAAKDTWLPGLVDLDLFLLFPPGLERERLETEGLAIGKLILPDWELRYAEHPYVTGRFQGFDADVVPAYRVSDATRIQSAVDRTPFHNAWVKAAVAKDPGVTREIRLMKAWLRGIEVYGAETAQRGVSGYLAEVLTIAHHGFIPALEWLARAEPGARLDPTGGSPAAFPDDPLTVIDPIDPQRNAAAAVRGDRFARLSTAAAAFLSTPSSRFFEPAPLVPPSMSAAARLLGEGGLVIVTLPVPEMREDAIIPHLERAAGAMGGHLARAGFNVERTLGGTTADGARAFLAVRTAQARLPAVRLHVGPPVGLQRRADEFRAKYAEHPDTADGPFDVDWEGTRRVAVRIHERDRDLEARTLGLLSRVSLGKHADRAVRRGGIAVHAWPDALRDPRLAMIIAELLCPRAPWERQSDPEHDYAVPAEAAPPS